MRAAQTRIWVSDLEDLRTDDGDFVGGPRSFGAFLGRVVEAATARSGSGWSRTAIPCGVRRPGKRRCAGFIEVKGAPKVAVEWRCRTCRSRGTISGWQGGPEDLRGARDRRPSGRRLAVSLSREQYEALGGGLCVWVDHPQVMAAAIHDPSGDAVVLAGTVDELDALCESIAPDANHAENRKIQRLLDGGYDRITRALAFRAGRSDIETRDVVAGDAITAAAVADRMGEMLGMKGGMPARFQETFLEGARRLVETEKLIVRIRKVAAACHGKPALVQTFDLAGALDQAATFARAHPELGVRVLTAFVAALRDTSLEEIDGLVVDSAAALLGAAHTAHDTRVMVEALAALLVAHVHDRRFGAALAVIDRARLGKRARKAGLGLLAAIRTADGSGRKRADALRLTLAGPPPS